MFCVPLLVALVVLGGGAQGAAHPSPTATVAEDVSGEWSGEVKLPVSYSPIPMYFKLQQNGNEVSGTAGPAPGSQYPISQVRRSGNALHFVVSGEGLTYTFDLKVEEDVLSGDAKSEDSQSHTSTGKASLTRTPTTHK